MLLLPGDPEFDRILATPPPNWREMVAQKGSFSFIARAGSGILEPCSSSELDDYLNGGEYEERLKEIDDEGDIYEYEELEEEEGLIYVPDYENAPVVEIPTFI